MVREPSNSLLAFSRLSKENGRLLSAAKPTSDMTLIALGINHNTAAVEVREKVAFSSSQIEPALLAAQETTQVGEIAILSTCNRTEIYCHLEGDYLELLRWLADYKQTDFEQLKAAHYSAEGVEAARHMMLVASGLDSMVLGEPQILGQMKAAYAMAKESGALGGLLHDAFQRVFGVAKKVRSETAIGENPVSVAYAAVSLAQQIFSDLREDTALLIGAGETIELVARHLVDQGMTKIIVANRTLENATELSEKFGAEPVLLADIPNVLHRADIVISSTASQLPLLGKGAVETALKKRKRKPMFMVDIAVPRDIEPQVNEIAEVYLYTVDDLREVIDESKRSRMQAAEIAREIINEAVMNYERDLRALSVVNAIKAFRTNIEEIKQVELGKSLKNLANGVPPDQVLDQLASSLTQKFMHEPTVQLRRAGADGRKDLIIGMQTLFSLQLEDSEQNESEDK